MFGVNDYEAFSPREYYLYSYAKHTCAVALVAFRFLEYCLYCALSEYTASVPGSPKEFSSWYPHQKSL
jgi:hypothetical protein